MIQTQTKESMGCVLKVEFKAKHTKMSLHKIYIPQAKHKATNICITKYHSIDKSRNEYKVVGMAARIKQSLKHYMSLPVTVK